jgi:ABC-type Mn2+/Zn2+ transport system permease subunit
VAISSVCVVLGLAISFHYGTAGGATMAGLSVLVFFVVFTAKEVTASVRRRTSRSPAA